MAEDTPTATPLPRFALHLVTLGVTDLDRACAFYATMGLERRDLDGGGVAFFRAGNVVLSLYPRATLAQDATLPDTSPERFCGLTLACNVASEEDVGQVIGRAVAAGGTLVKPAQKAFWGGHQRLFRRPRRASVGSGAQPLLPVRRRRSAGGAGAIGHLIRARSNFLNEDE